MRERTFANPPNAAAHRESAAPFPPSSPNHNGSPLTAASQLLKMPPPPPPPGGAPPASNMHTIRVAPHHALCGRLETCCSCDCSSRVPAAKAVPPALHATPPHTHTTTYRCLEELKTYPVFQLPSHLYPPPPTHTHTRTRTPLLLCPSPTLTATCENFVMPPLQVPVACSCRGEFSIRGGLKAVTPPPRPPNSQDFPYTPPPPTIPCNPLRSPLPRRI